MDEIKPKHKSLFYTLPLPSPPQMVEVKKNFTRKKKKSRLEHFIITYYCYYYEQQQHWEQQRKLLKNLNYIFDYKLYICSIYTEYSSMLKVYFSVFCVYIIVEIINLMNHMIILTAPIRAFTRILCWVFLIVWHVFLLYFQWWKMKNIFHKVYEQIIRKINKFTYVLAMLCFILSYVGYFFVTSLTLEKWLWRSFWGKQQMYRNIYDICKHSAIKLVMFFYFLFGFFIFKRP